MKTKVRIDTLSDALAFVKITSTLGGKIVLCDSEGLRVNAKSLLGVLHSIEFSELWCESDEDIRSRINEFIVND